MPSLRSLLAAGAVILLTAAPGLAQVPARVRGIIAAVDEFGLTVKQRDGNTLRLLTTAETRYADVVPSSLNEIKVNDYIGTAIKGPSSHPIAVEIVLVPEAMRAGRIGYYDWDPLPDTSGIDPAGTTITSMTNGLVVDASAAPSIANGTVTASGESGANKTLTVALVDGTVIRIIVSPIAPITRFVLSDRSTVSVGSAAVVWTGPGGKPTLVAVGKGVVSPM